MTILEQKLILIWSLFGVEGLQKEIQLRRVLENLFFNDIENREFLSKKAA